MLQTDLIEIINRGDAWAFVGSGASIGSGCPAWGELVAKVLLPVEEQARTSIQADPVYESAMNRRDFAACFSRIEHHVGRAALEGAVTDELRKTTTAKEVMKRLADLPFAGYITTNYDQLLEAALRDTGELGWSPVGNSADEVRKVSGDANHIIWHIHGCAGMSTERSRLVLTAKDYDDLYLEDAPAIVQLRGLLAQRRVVFIGFGFQDPEVTRLLKRVERLSNPARPLYAFLSGLSSAKHDVERRELLDSYNVDVIPYEVIGNSHEQLSDLLDVYGSFVLRRSLKLGQPARACPCYDPETTGLLVYNELCLREGPSVSGNI
jgi:hypothetical protein